MDNKPKVPATASNAPATAPVKKPLDPRVHVTVLKKEFVDKLKALDAAGVSPSRIIDEALTEYFKVTGRKYKIKARVKVEEKEVSI